VALLREEFALAADSSEVVPPGPGTDAAQLVRRHGFDGAAVLADEPRTTAALASLPEPARIPALDVIAAWRDGVRQRFGPVRSDAWDERRLEHRFALTAAAGARGREVTLAAEEYVGGHLDWYSFEVGRGPSEKEAEQPGRSAEAGARDAEPSGGTVSVIPTPVRYAGMPAPRWWAFEDGQTHFGDIAAAPGDLARLLLADVATVYGNDWFSVPLRLPIGTLARITTARVFDTMGRRLDIPSAAVLDSRSTGPRGFRLYELSGDPSVESGVAPLLFVPPSLSGSELGPALDRVDFVRDESANVVWAVERYVEGPLGRPVDRLQHWRASGVSSPDPKTGSSEAGDEAKAATAEAAESAVWRYRLQATAPPFWIPFVPVRIGGGAQVRLRRARMQAWELLDRVVVGARSSLLQPDRPMAVEEEEVPHGGISVERRWQAARWIDGSVHVWLQRSKRAGAAERSAGLAWDRLEDPGPGGG
jgi:hypothetical protein